MSTFRYRVVGASVPGAKRFSEYEPSFATHNQDGYLVLPFDDALLVLVGDGCSESIHSAVGMRVLLRIFARSMIHAYKVTSPDVVEASDWWDDVESTLREGINIFASDLELPGQSFARVINDYCLFAFVGALITPQNTWIFGCGDAIYAINSEWSGENRYKDNRPPYFAFSLLDDLAGWNIADVSLRIIEKRPTASIRSISLASDGIIPLLTPEGLLVPGTSTPVPDINSVLAEDLTFRNPNRLRQFLLTLVRSSYRMVGSPPQLLVEEGVLFDDPTLVSLRFE